MAVDANSSPPRSELGLRVISGVVMAVVALLTLWWGGWPFALLWTLVGVIAASEWLKIVLPDAPDNYRFGLMGAIALAGLTAFIGHEALAIGLSVAAAFGAWLLVRSPVRLIAAAGILYAAAIAIAPIIVRLEPHLGLTLIAWCFAVVWATDVAAYFSGRAFGGPKLWPAVSPKKTWSGAIGGALAGVLAGLAVSLIARRTGVPWPLGAFATMVCGLAASAAGQAGDLLESSLKRRFGVKDSGSIIPGHGGVLDRLDAFVVVVTLVAVAVAIWR